MPQRDGTGPLGQGPMSGRGMGFCIKELAPGVNAWAEFGCRRGFRRWLRGCDYSVNIPDETKKVCSRNKEISCKNVWKA